MGKVKVHEELLERAVRIRDWECSRSVKNDDLGSETLLLTLLGFLFPRVFKLYVNSVWQDKNFILAPPVASPARDSMASAEEVKTLKYQITEAKREIQSKFTCLT